MVHMSFSGKYQEIIRLVENELAQLEGKINSFDLVMPELNSYAMRKSKHIRAVLSFLFLKAVGISVDERQIVNQGIVELIHNASLIHDDVIDESDSRRGESSLNIQDGNRLAVISGDYLLSVALAEIVSLNSLQLVSIYSKTLKEMCVGEIKQNITKFKIPTIDDYIEKSYKKTGALFEAALDGSLSIAKKKYSPNFAKLFGIAFQIRDDILNITENRADSDIENGIYTAPVIYSNNPANPLAGIEKAKGLLNNYVEKIINEISGLPENEFKVGLLKLSELLKDE